MPRIGTIDVPDTLWMALVENASKEFTEMAFDVARKVLKIDLTEASSALELEDLENYLPNLHRCVVTLVRIQTGDFLSPDEAVQDSEHYKGILIAARNTGDQIAYTALSSGSFTGLKTLVDSNWQDLAPYL